MVETALCLADGVQASTGCTPGHRSLRIEDFGKLAVCLARSDTKVGVRIILKRAPSQLVDDWMMRKLGHEEEKELTKELLHLEDVVFRIEEVTVEQFSEFDEGKIIKCEECGELFLESKAVRKQGKAVCKACSGLRYYTPCRVSLTEGVNPRRDLK